MPHPFSFLIPEKILKLDSAAFTDKKSYVISDRSNYREEYPIAKISLISTEKYDMQIRIAIHGNHHIENFTKFRIDPKAWNSWGWIIIPVDELEKLNKVIAKMYSFSHFRKEK